MTELVPSPAMDACMFSLEPSPMASIAMTDATPIMMPNMVSSTRNLFLASDR